MLMMINTQDNVNETGDPVKAKGYHGQGALQTVAIQVVNFTGRVYIEATLKTNPTDADWFPIQLTESTPYVQYPVNPFAFTGSIPTNGDTSCTVYSFVINAVYLRARMDRTYLNNPFLYQSLNVLAHYGIVEKITLI
jgi:hypothetical protein